jgi:putative transposase
LKIRNQRDFGAGIMYMVIGLFFAIVARQYQYGTAAKMGPGYFPFWLGILMAAIGLLVLVRSYSAKAAIEAIPKFRWRIIAQITGAVILYGLLLPKSQILRTNHTGTGKIVTLHSNTRWCSDAFEIRCFNDEKVFVAFSLDCNDREAISYVASKEPLLGKSIQELMIHSVEKRFKNLKTQRQIEWLSDRGSIYRDKSVQNLARNLGLKPCYTAPYSPSSNGMAEAFVGTFKRDYVYVNDCYSADWVLEHLEEWFWLCKCIQVKYWPGLLIQILILINISTMIP